MKTNHLENVRKCGADPFLEADPTKAYNQDDATGFIRLNGLRLRVNAAVNGARNLAKSA